MNIRNLDLQTFAYVVDFGVAVWVGSDVYVGWDKWDEMYKWCEDNFGPPFDYSVHSWVMDNSKWAKKFGGIRFNEEAHRNLFILRWG